MQRSFAALAFACAMGAASAQLIGPATDWKEVEAPPPPALRTSGLIPLEVRGTSLRFGVDPSSISVGKDGVVRYVVVAASSTGAVNGMYEGLRCSSGEVKVYARHQPDSGWVPVAASEWRSVHNTPNSRYSLAIARSGACMGTLPGGSASEIARYLSSSDGKFQRELAR